MKKDIAIIVIVLVGFWVLCGVMVTHAEPAAELVCNGDLVVPDDGYVWNEKFYHLRYSPTQEVLGQIEKIEGVNNVSLVDRYRVRVGIGEAFQWREDGIEEQVLNILSRCEWR